MQTVKSTCCYCGVGCGVLISTEAGRIVDVKGDPDHPANFGRLCTKGSTLHLTALPDARLLAPQRRASRDEPLLPASWDDTLEQLADQFAETILAHGPDSVGFYISGQLLTEDYYVFNKLAKGLIQTNNVDTNSRLCMSSAVVGYKTTLGADSPPACYDDVNFAETLFIAGSNTAYAHPILFRRIEQAKKDRPEMKVIVVDPRSTDTAAFADLHLPILPGTDVALFNGMLHILLWEGMVDQGYIRAHTEGFDALKATVRDYTPALVADICGIPEADLIQAAHWFGASNATLSLYCMGLNQSSCGTDKNAALINLHLATGQIGKPGAGPFSLTGQPNAMGGREVGGLATLLSGHRDLANAEHRAEVAKLWGIDTVPATPGKSAVEMFNAVREGEIKLLWIACTNPAQSMPNANIVREALQKAELVVVQEAYAQTDTTAYADVLLPASSWGEKEGTVTNSERRITHVRPAVPAPGEARNDWEIVVDFARRLEKRLRPGQPSLFAYEQVEQVFDEHKATTAGRDLDITGLSYALLDTQGPQQWPFPAGASAGKVRLYEDGVFPTCSGKAKFANIKYEPVAENIDARYPLHLTTGRLRDQWHGMSRTGTIGRLYSHVEEPLITLNAADMRIRNLVSGDIVRVKSRRGEVVLRVIESEEMRIGQAFIPMHWGSQHMSGIGINALTTGAYDPQSKQPELKHCAIQIEKIELPWQMVIMRRGDTIRRWQALQPYLGRFTYATAGLFGRDDPAVILRIACSQAPDETLLAELDDLLNINDASRCMVYNDRKRGISKRVLVGDSGQIDGVRLTGETAARDWLKELMEAGTPAADLRKWMLAPAATPPSGGNQRGKIICNCLNVSERDIKAAIEAGQDLEQLQDSLKCGTSCGSCVPEIKRMISISRATT